MKLNIIRFDPIRLGKEPPLFIALDTLGIRSADICELLEISNQAWYSWRTGERNCPKPIQVFLTNLCIAAIDAGESAILNDTLTAEREAGAGLVYDWKQKLRENIDYAKRLVAWQATVVDTFPQEDKDAGKALGRLIEAKLPSKSTKKTTTKTTRVQKRR